VDVSSEGNALPQPAKRSVVTNDTRFRQQIALECDAMARYALGTGLKLPLPLQQSIDMFENVFEQDDNSVPTATLTTLHSQLADVVGPATPRTIYLLHVDKPRNTWLSILGPLASIRRLNLGTALSTLIFVFSSLSDSISHKNLSMDIYSLDGMESLQVLVFLMSAAAMGGCFQSMFIAHTFIQKGTYDPRFESSYWMRISLGIIAGLVLSQMIPIGPGPETGDAVSPAAAFGKPLLALLGGFSATLVYTILQRLVDTVESLFTQRQAPAKEVGANRSMAINPADPAILTGMQTPAPANSAAPTPDGTTPAAPPVSVSVPAPAPGPLTAAAATVAAIAAATTAATAATGAALDASAATAPSDLAEQPADGTSQADGSDAVGNGQVDAPESASGPAAEPADAATLKSA
jgi:hypothetical protein